MNGARDRDPHWSIVLSSQVLNEEQKKGEEEDSVKLGGMGWVRWRKGGYGSREINILIKGAILGFARDLTLEGFPSPRRDPQIVP